MFRRFISLILAIAIITAMWIAPVQASSEEPVVENGAVASVTSQVAQVQKPTDKHFSVDFNNMEYDGWYVYDETGNYIFTEEALIMPDLKFEYDEIIQQNVLVLEGDGALVWRSIDGSSLNGRDLSEAGLTLEALVYISTDPDTFKQSMVIFEANDTGLHFQEYNDGVDLCSGLRAGDLNMQGGWNMANAYVEDTFPHMRWTHLVGSVSGEKNEMYIDGELVASVDRVQPILKSQFDQGNDGIYVGESQLGSVWGATAFYGKIAKVAIYNESVSAEQVAAMWADSPANPENYPEGVPIPTPKPTKEPTPEPTPVPTPEPTPEPTPIILPTGEHYSLSVSSVKPFNAGDDVTIRLAVADIKDSRSLMGIDLGIMFNNELLEYKSASSSAADINAGYPNGEVKWELIMNTTKADQGELMAFMLDDGTGWLGTSKEGAIWIDLSFTAIKDGKVGDYLLHTTEVDGTDGEYFDSAYGNGIVAYVKEPASDSDITGVGIIRKPTKTIYSVGEELDLTGLQAIIKYKDRIVEYVEAEDLIIDKSAFDNQSAGRYLINIKKGEKFATFSVNVVIPPVTVTGLGIVSKPSKTAYRIGEKLDISGLQLLVKYSDGSSEIVGSGEIVLDSTDFDNTAPGNYTIKVKKENRLAQFTVRVEAVPVTVTGIGIAQKPAKTMYLKGEGLDFTGLKVLVRYSDGTEEYVNNEAVSIDSSAFNSEEVGKYQIFVNKDGKRTYFNVSVLEPAPVVVTGIGIVAKPVKTNYLVGEVLDASGMKILVKYSDGASRIVDADAVEIDSSAMGTGMGGSYSIIVSYEGKKAQYTVNVKGESPVVVTGVGIVAKPTKRFYATGEELDFTGLQLLIKYSNGNSAIVGAESVDVDITEFNNQEQGVYLITVSKEGKVAQFSVHVN